jgi:hypothetical protein
MLFALTGVPGGIASKLLSSRIANHLEDLLGIP